MSERITRISDGDNDYVEISQAKMSLDKLVVEVVGSNTETGDLDSVMLLLNTKQAYQLVAALQRTIIKCMDYELPFEPVDRTPIDEFWAKQKSPDTVTESIRHFKLIHGGKKDD